MSRDPWSELAMPASAGDISALRVDPSAPWNFFWGRNREGEDLLLLLHAEESRPEVPRLPTLQGVTVSLTNSSAGQGSLLFRLVERQQRDIFHALCIDIMTAAGRAESEAAAVLMAIQRTWRWHHLLKGGRDGRLSPEEQKGLIGELHVLHTVLFPVLGPEDALNSWGGPFGDPKDFSIGKVAIESKARRGAARPFVAISSEYQLETKDVELFLHVLEIDRAPTDQAEAMTLTGVVQRTEKAVSSAGGAASDALEQRLAAAGYRSEDDYGAFCWSIEGGTLYAVRDSFPRIDATDLRAGVRDVRYSIDLVQCKAFEVNSGALVEALQGDPDVSRS